MKSLFERLRVGRLATTFTILATLSAGILIGSVMAHGVKGQESKIDSSDASPLRVPNAKILSNTFSQIAKQVGPAVVNINTETLPKASTSLKRKNPHLRQQPNGPDEQQPGDDDDDQDNQDGGQGGQAVPPGFQDFFNRFFGGPDQGAPDDGGGVRESLGSGFIVDAKGYIITNNHVVDKADKIFVKLSTDPEGEQGRPAHVVGVDKDTDIAVIKIDAREPLPTVKMGNSEAAQVGDWVIAIGSPFDLSQTVTAGIVSAKNRTIEKGAKGQFQHFIQTDAAINPGNSGGPLLDMDGDVIGVNTAIYTQSAGYQGIGFAMPSNTVINTYNQLIGPEHKVVRGSIGITFQPDLPSAVGRVYGFKTGVLISNVQPGGPGDKAGLKAGDIIVSIDGRSIKDGDDLVNDIAVRKPGSSAKLGYLRSGKEGAITVVIGDRSKVFSPTQVAETDNNQGPDQQSGSETRLGLSVEDVPAQATSKMGIHGVVVKAVKPGSFADEIGVLQGAVIISVNKQKVDNLTEFRAAISGLKSGQDVVFELIDPRSPKSGSVFRAGTLP
jgi:serine protease Do